MKIKIMTKAINEEHLVTGATLVFNTIRTGYPNAQIECYDATENKKCISHIKASCKKVDASYTEKHQEDSVWMKEQIYKEKEPITFIHPDVIFWNNCEEWDFSQYLFAGRLIPTCYEEIVRAISLARIHPSFLIIPDPEKLKNRVEELRAKHFIYDPFIAYSFKFGNKWFYYDNIANLSEVFSHEAYAFKQNELDYYDHLFGGSISQRIIDSREGKAKEDYLSWVDAVKAGQWDKLRGIWLNQEMYFKREAL